MVERNSQVHANRVTRRSICADDFITIIYGKVSNIANPSLRSVSEEPDVPVPERVNPLKVLYLGTIKQANAVPWNDKTSKHRNFFIYTVIVTLNSNYHTLDQFCKFLCDIRVD